jgi:hypothetical protein
MWCGAPLDEHTTNINAKYTKPPLFMLWLFIIQLGIIALFVAWVLLVR